MIPIHHGLSEIADRYDAFVVDLWGVLHDGVSAFPEEIGRAHV
jgi:ribonucleotide monophosphatase NagD (HAD superfamily)